MINVGRIIAVMKTLSSFFWLIELKNKKDTLKFVEIFMERTYLIQTYLSVI